MASGRSPTKRPAAADTRRAKRATSTARESTARVPVPVLPRVAKGKRPRFHADPNVDRLFAIVTALTAELSVVGERLMTLERVLIARGALAADAVETHEIDEAESSARLQWREGLIERVFQPLESDY